MSTTDSSSLPPGFLTDPSRPLTFTFDGRTIPALAGQSIGAALYAAGVRVFTRSFKYHRPRGLFCVSGDCPNCLMHVDGRPNVRTCVEPVRQGQVVRHQNAWPSLDSDVLHVFDKLDRFLPVGFYYKRFHKPRWLWPIFEHVVRHVAGLGRIDVRAAPTRESEVEYLHTEVCVVGSGLAGITAAVAACASGADVLLIERESYLGGFGVAFDPRFAASPLLRALEGAPGLRILRNTTVFGLYEGNLLGALQGQRLLKIRAQQIIVCTGGRQRPFLFHNNDLPGIMLGRGVLRLASLYGVRAGRRAVVFTDTTEGYVLADQLSALGMKVWAVIDRRNVIQDDAERQRVNGVPRSVVVAARGTSHLQAVRVAALNAAGEYRPGLEVEIPCDLLCLVPATVPANELLLQGGMRFRYTDGGWVAEQGVPGLWAAGAAAGTLDIEAKLLEGQLRGAQAAAALGYQTLDLDEQQRKFASFAVDPLLATCTGICPSAENEAGKRFVCLCEDVTEKDLHQAVLEGFDHIETLKRYSTVNMGPCQGKVCGQLASEVCARAIGRNISAVGSTTSRPPVVPVELGVLAAARHHPVRRTPLHHWHDAAGARWLDAGLWKRPESYGAAAAEVRAVRTGVGLIDVSTLGKIEVVGPDAAELLERIYLNKWADLKPGRARYGALCTDEGILFDDGVGARLGPQHFYLTATTGNADAVFQWLELWRATWRLDVTLLNQTSANAAMNLAGPRARDVLGRLTSLDLSPAASPYMAARQAEVAGVSCHLLRIGFVGELGYEIHCPSAYAQHLWEALCGAGAEFGLKPFGVEAQRILRLEKGHLIVGQDTDALSNPLDAGLGWLVRFDKPLFHGREPLLRLKAMGARSRLVGFHMADTDRVPGEGCQVVERGQSVGRVTSARYSPTCRRSLGLAWVPAAKRTGEHFLIRWNGADVPAVVASLPFYDPEGVRLKG